MDLVVAQLVEELARCQQRELDRPRLEALRATLGDAQTPSDQGLSLAAEKLSLARCGGFRLWRGLGFWL